MAHADTCATGGKLILYTSAASLYSDVTQKLEASPRSFGLFLEGCSLTFKGDVVIASLKAVSVLLCFRVKPCILNWVNKIYLLKTCKRY